MRTQLSNSTSQDYLAEANDHLKNGRFRMALTSAKNAFQAKPDDSETALCLAWALLENGYPAKAMDYANLAVELSGGSIKARMYRGYLLMRMSILEGAIEDFDKSIAEQKDFLAFTYINKARTLAGMGKFEEGQKTLELALLINNNRNESWKKSRKWYETASEIEKGKLKIKDKVVDELLEMGQEAIKTKDHWFALYVSNKILESDRVKKENDEIELLNLEAMLHLFQIRPALKKAAEIKSKFSDSKKFENIYSQLLKIQNADQEEELFEKQVSSPPPVSLRETKETFNKPVTKVEDKTYVEAPPPQQQQIYEPENLRSDSVYFINDDAEVFSTKVFNVEEDKKTGKRVFYIHFDVNTIKNIGVEVIFNNPYFRMEDRVYHCRAVWFLNDYEIASNDFKLSVQNDWDSVIFAQTCGSNLPGFWQYGQGRVDIYVEDAIVCQKWFVLNDEAIKEEIKVQATPPETSKETKMEVVKTKEQKEKDSPQEKPKEEKEKTLEELLAELDKFIGLGSVKKSMRDFVDYLNFMQERKKLGLKSSDGLAINAVFLGNPGTGKTTVARVVGEIFKAMKILPKGHIVEVDRSALVGQYVGETAQKTDKVIEDAMGGVLFVDEAYTLVKEGGGGQDFGQEAIDILLKRMEDKKGQFVVIAAGYPDNMETFLSSNPGMKSRFTHFFNFEDYSPDELLQIIDMFLKKEEYKITDDAKELLKKEFINLYRGRDKTFGNGRLARKYFEDAKMQLSRRVIKLPDAEKTKESMTTITIDDIKSILEKDKAKDVKLPINEEMLTEGLTALEKLTGLGSVKADVRDMVKLARYYIEQGEDVKDKFTSHILFLGNPGTGKTTVARILGKIYAALGILPKGHLVETDRQGLVAAHVGQTAIQTAQMIDKSIGGTLFVDEAYALVKEGGSDFGKEAIDTLLKRMEDDRGKFIVIAAGYTNEMKGFIESNPGMQSRFTKSFTFEDYTPEELMEIADRILNGKEMKLEDEARNQLMRYFNDIYRKRDKNFGNARIVRNLIDKAQQKMLLRLADTPQEERSQEMTKTMTLDDLSDQIMPKEEKKTYQTKGDPEKLEKYKKELYDLTGLDSVKRSVDKLISGLKVAQLRKERGLKVVDKSLHAVFMGNPGTGKTTVARLMSNLYKELGLIEKGHLVEVDRSELVAGYQGQTAIKTDKIIQQAIGGTLFIDEAYTLARGGNDFGQEAIDTLLKRMEDLRGQFICIVAGYPDNMKTFLDTNPGLQSRFTNFFLFEDYTPRQMLEISDQIANSSGYRLDEGALQLLLEMYTNMYENRDKNFGNARTARNILYKAISNQEERITNMYNLNDDALMTITFEDVEKVSENDY